METTQTQISDKFIYRDKSFSLWRVCGKSKATGDFFLYECDWDGNIYDPDGDYSEFSFAEIQQELEIVGSV
jgi:hypothetical protein